MLRSPKDEVTERDLAWAALMDKRHAVAMQIANSPDEEDRLRLLIVAGKVAQVHPAFARDPLAIVRGAIREHEAIRKSLRALGAE